MDTKPYRAFGLIFLVNYHYAGERYKNRVTNPDCTIFCAKGYERILNLDTGEAMPDYTTGWFHSPERNYVKGLFQLDVIEDTEIYCYDPKLNFNYDQKFEPWVIDTSAQTILMKGTRLLLCSGAIEIEGTTFTAPARLHIESGDKLATITEPANGLLLL